MANVLYEVLVPTIYGDTEKPISTKHHKEWDKWINKLTGGLTLMSPSKGKWIFEGREYVEKIIPVRIMVDEKWISKIINFTLTHYRQKAVMYYVVSREVRVIHAA